MLRSGFFLIYCTVVAFSSCAYAKDSADDVLKTVVQEVRRDTPEIIETCYGVRYAAHLLGVSNSSYYPYVFFKVRSGYAGYSSPLYAKGLDQGNVSLGSSVDMNMRYTLYDFGVRDFDYKAHAESFAVASIRNDIAESEVSVRAIRAYLKVVMTAKLQAMYQHYVKDLSDVFEEMSQGLRLGKYQVNELKELTSKIFWVRSHLLLVDQELNQVQRDYFISVGGEKEALKLADSFVLEQAIEKLSEHFIELRAKKVENDAEYVLLEKQKTQKFLEAHSKERSLAPHVDLVIDFSHSSGNDDFLKNIFNIPLPAKIGASNSASVVLELTMNFADGGAAHNEADKLYSEALNFDEKMQERSRIFNEKLTSIYRSSIVLKNLLDHTRKEQKNLESYFKTVNRLVEEGKVSPTEKLEVVSQYYESYERYLRRSFGTLSDVYSEFYAVGVNLFG